MIRFFIFLLLFLSKNSFGQISDSILKITFRYDKGHYSFGKSGNYSITEIIEYYKSNNSTFNISKHIQLKKYYDSATNSISVDTIKIRVSQKAFKDNSIKKLLIELNVSRDNFNSKYVKSYLEVPTKKEIINTADKYNLKWMIQNDYLDKKERKGLFSRIKNFSLLDSFLFIKKPNLEYHIVYSDVWNTLSVTFFSAKDTIEHQSQYFELFGQPVRKYVNEKYTSDNEFINLEINNYIKKLVPQKSLISEVVDLNQLKKLYIRWFIESKM